jgi:hypothetical protein
MSKPLDDDLKKKGFELFATDGGVRRITENITAVKTDLSGYHVTEFRDSKWHCDCYNFKQHETCEHVYASQFARNARRSFETEVKQEDEAHLLCRYCGSPDLRKCGFRYNAHGIAHCYYCHQCERKFSIRIVGGAPTKFPQEVVLLLDHVGRLASRLNELITELDSKVTALTSKGR